MRLTMLGTGNATVTNYYNTCFVLENNNEYLLVDGGGGNMLLRQLKLANIDLMKIKQVFITHKHTDHLLGIIWVIRMVAQATTRGKYQNDLYLYSHQEVITIIDQMAKMLLAEKDYQHLGQNIHLVVLNDGDSINVLDGKLTAFDIHSTKATQFGFCLEYDGKKLTCCGDEPYEDSAYAYVLNSDYLLHEAFCLYEDKDKFKPYEKHHSTVKDACELAGRLKVKNLLLYHSEDKTYPLRSILYAKEGKKYYAGNLLIPNDLDSYDI